MRLRLQRNPVLALEDKCDQDRGEGYNRGDIYVQEPFAGKNMKI